MKFDRCWDQALDLGISEILLYKTHCSRSDQGPSTPHKSPVPLLHSEIRCLIMKTFPKVFPSEFEGPPVTSATAPLGRQPLDPTRRETILNLVEMLLQQNGNNGPGMLLEIRLVDRPSGNAYQVIVRYPLLKKTRMFVSNIYRYESLCLLMTFLVQPPLMSTCKP